MISIERFLTLLEEKELLAPREAAKIREQMAKAPAPFTAETLAKQLVKREYITLSQAKRLLATEAGEAPPKPAATVVSKPVEKPVAPKPSAKEDDELGLAPMDDEPVERPPKKKPISPPVKTPIAAPTTVKPAAKPAAARPAAKPAVSSD